MRVQWAPPAQEALPAKRFGSLGPVGRKLETKRKLTCLLCCARSSRTLRRRPRQQQRQLPQAAEPNCGWVLSSVFVLTSKLAPVEKRTLAQGCSSSFVGRYPQNHKKACS